MNKITATITMLTLQDSLNAKTQTNWRNAGSEWYRAIWLECAELIEHHGYKWWNKQEPDMSAVRMELIDIWHFGLSDILRKFEPHEVETVAARLVADLGFAIENGEDISIVIAAERLASEAVTHHYFSLYEFGVLMKAVGISFEELYKLYIGKNVLNVFRQNYGYKDGTYEKVWAGLEDNERLTEVLNKLPVSDHFPQELYAELERVYFTLTGNPIRAVA